MKLSYHPWKPINKTAEKVSVKKTDTFLVTGYTMRSHMAPGRLWDRGCSCLTIAVCH